MIRRSQADGRGPGIHLVGLGLLLLGLSGVTPARAGQDVGTWEFHFAYARPSFDGEPIEIDARASADFDGDGDQSQGLLTQTIELGDDESFFAFRLGYVWTFWLETELTYDRNHAGADYSLVVRDLDSGDVIESAEGGASTILTTYQFAALYHPLGNKGWRWQPYVFLGGGWIDADFTPAEEIADVTESGLVAGTFSSEFPKGDHGLMVSYGVGVKWFAIPELAIRGEWRSKQYDLFDERRLDREISIGVSFFTAGY